MWVWVRNLERRHLIAGGMIAVLALVTLVYALVRVGTSPPPTRAKKEVVVKTTTTEKKETKKEVVAQQPAQPVQPVQVKQEAAKPVVTCAPQSYTVVRGDSLWRIARRHWGGRAYFWPVLAEVNHLRNPNLIRIGKVLTLPCLCDLPPLKHYLKRAAVSQPVPSARLGQPASPSASVMMPEARSGEVAAALSLTVGASAAIPTFPALAQDIALLYPAMVSAGGENGFLSKEGSRVSNSSKN